MISLTDPGPRHKQTRKNNVATTLVDYLATRLRSLIAKMKLAKQNSAQRHALRSLNEYQLNDIGLTREQIDAEFGRSIFDIAESRYTHIGLLKGGLTDYRRKQITRLPND